MVIAEAPTRLDGLASAAAIILIFEISIFVILFAVLTALLAFVTRWLYNHVIPPLHTVAPRIVGGISATDRVTGRVVDVVANLYARGRGVEEAVTSFVEGIIPITPSEEPGTPRPSDEQDNGSNATGDV